MLAEERSLHSCVAQRVCLCPGMSRLGTTLPWFSTRTQCHALPVGLAQAAVDAASGGSHPPAQHTPPQPPTLASAVAKSVAQVQAPCTR